MRWSVLKPTEATANLPHLSVQDDGSIFASGDQSKRDLYTLRFSHRLERITAIRLEVLPDDRLPRGGPGRIYYEGPFGDFFLSELSVRAGGQGRCRSSSRPPPARTPAAVAAAIDGDPQTGWSLGGGQGTRAFGRLSTRRTPERCRRSGHPVALRALLRGRAGPLPDLGHDRPATRSRHETLPPRSRTCC